MLLDYTSKSVVPGDGSSDDTEVTTCLVKLDRVRLQMTEVSDGEQYEGDCEEEEE